MAQQILNIGAAGVESGDDVFEWGIVSDNQIDAAFHRRWYGACLSEGDSE